MRICNFPECGRKHDAKGLCNVHYRQKYLKHQELTPIGAPRYVAPLPECSADGCVSSVNHRNGPWCNKHWQRMYHKGSLAAPVRPTQDGDPKWVGDSAAYRTVHHRLRRTKGPATAHQCVSCPEKAAHWAYQYGSPQEQQSNHGPYTTDLSYYEPMCAVCHKVYDLKQAQVA